MGLFFYTYKSNYKEVGVQKMRINGCAFVQFFVFFLKKLLTRRMPCVIITLVKGQGPVGHCFEIKKQ